MIISAMQGGLGLASGALVGFSLGLVGGGGSILAVPLMVYVVGVADAHVAIGTSAIAVAVNAAINLSNHARGGTVRWSCALPFAAAGIAGALGLTRLMKSLLFEVSATDPLIFGAVSIGLIVISLAAMSIPARRAIRVDPLDALRQE